MHSSSRACGRTWIGRCAAREIGCRQLALGQPLSFPCRRGGDRRFELALASLGPVGFFARGFDVAQRFRERAHLLVDVLFADPPERVERVFSRHDGLMLAHCTI